MSVTTEMNAKEKVATIVSDILARRAVKHRVKVDDDLNEAGLNSLDMVSLMLSVEAEFDLQIPEVEMTPRNFRSIAAIDTLVTHLLQAR